MSGKMSWFYRRLGKSLGGGENGFSMVDLLIVVLVLSGLAIFVVPNAGAYLATPKLEAANTEALNVKAAALFAQHTTGKYPASSSELFGGAVDYLSAKPDAIYIFDPVTGLITSALASNDVGNPNPDDGPTAKLQWSFAKQSWQRQSSIFR